jgi:hypothetical protein
VRARSNFGCDDRPNGGGFSHSRDFTAAASGKLIFYSQNGQDAKCPSEFLYKNINALVSEGEESSFLKKRSKKLLFDWFPARPAKFRN